MALRLSHRPRHYVSPATLALIRPLLRYSSTRDAYVVRFVGNHRGPVIRRERRSRAVQHAGPERRQAIAG
jgi:hypothetical protein